MKTINGVTILGTNLVPTKVVDFIEHVLTSNYKGDVNHIMFRAEGTLEEPTKDTFGAYVHDAKMVIVNLHKHVQSAKEEISNLNEENGTQYIAVHTNLWLSVTNTILHELLHNEADKVEKDSGEKSTLTKDELEASIVAEARIWLREIAKAHEMEPPSLQEWIAVLPMIAELQKLITESKEPWTELQRKMQELKVVYYNNSGAGENYDAIETLRQFLQIAKGDEKEEPWPTEVKPLVIPAAQTIIDVASTDGKVFVATNTEFLVHEDETPEFEESGLSEGAMQAMLMSKMMAGTAPMANMWAGEATMASPVNSWQPEGAPMTRTAYTNMPAPEAHNINAMSNMERLALMGGGSNFGTTFNQPQVAFPQHNEGVFCLPKLNMTEQQIDTIMRSFIMKMAKHIFINCGYVPGGDDPFNQKENIYQPLDINDIPGLDQLIMAFDTDVSGKTEKHTGIWDNSSPHNRGKIIGCMFKKGGKPQVTAQGMPIAQKAFPAYRFILNSNGMPVDRMFMPQNVNTLNRERTGLSKNAQRARSGELIAYLMKTNTPPGQSPFIATFNRDLQGVVTITFAKDRQVPFAS